MVIAQNFIAAYDNHDLKALRNLYSSDATIETVDFKGAQPIDSAIQKYFIIFYHNNLSPDAVKKILKY